LQLRVGRQIKRGFHLLDKAHIARSLQIGEAQFTIHTSTAFLRKPFTGYCSRLTVYFDSPLRPPILPLLIWGKIVSTSLCGRGIT
jgi:hypothetical protein